MPKSWNTRKGDRFWSCFAGRTCKGEWVLSHNFPGRQSDYNYIRQIKPKKK